MSQIFDRRWILDTNALSYISGRNREALMAIGLIANDHLFCEWPRITNPSPHEAALILQRLIVDRKVGVRIDGDGDWRFFRFALPEGNGGAFNLKLLRRIEQFEVNSDELLSALPAEPAPTQALETAQEAPAALPHAEAATAAEHKGSPRKRRAPQRADVESALLELNPSGPPANRKVAWAAVRGKIGRPVSDKTIDRARDAVWPR